MQAGQIAQAAGREKRSFQKQEKVGKRVNHGGVVLSLRGRESGRSGPPPFQGVKITIPNNAAPTITAAAESLNTVRAKVTARMIARQIPMIRGPSALALWATGAAKFAPTTAMIPAVAGTTPRSTAWTTVLCCTASKPAARIQVTAALGSIKPATDAA